MEKETLITAMKSSISDVLETMFFLPLDYSDTADPAEIWGRDGVIVSKLNFSGPFVGHFVFVIPEELAKSLTAGFLGEDEENVSQDHVNGTAKEMINMIAGNAFANYDDQAVFNLDIPELIRLEEVEHVDSDLEETIFITIDTPEDQLAVKMVRK